MCNPGPVAESMLSSRVFRKLLAASAGIYLVASLLLGLVISRWQADELADQVDARLQTAARLVAGDLADEISAGRSEALQLRVRKLAQQTDIRYTLINREGVVLADSSQADLAGVAKMQSHDERPEVVRALARGEDTSEHTSASLGERYRYVAARVEVDGKSVGVARAAMPRSAIDELMSAKRRLVWSAIAVIFLAALASSYWVIRQVVQPVTDIDKAVDAIARGDFRHRIYVPNHDELGQLAGKLNRMSQEIDSRLRNLTASHERQATVLGGMIEGVIAVDRRERVLFANSAAGRLFDFRPPQVEGRRLLEVVRNHTLEEAVAAALATRQPQRLETTQDSGDKMSVAIQATPLPGDPCPGVVIVMHETTELRRLESLRRDFVANVSHELKTPLSSIKAYAETLRNGALNDPQASVTFVERIMEQADRLHHLILDMLSLARIESTQHVFEIVPISIQEVADECISNQRPTAEAKRIELIAEPQSPGCFVRADKEGLREILDNLVDNAIKYTPEGGRVVVRWRVTADAKMASIEVEDTGIGIPEEELPRVFERFYRVDKARSRELGGTGLGLAIVKHLAQSFGGGVSAASESGRGSRFIVELPLA
jgi:two-component system phosphate regulon sensor histidine kinase PhoR